MKGPLHTVLAQMVQAYHGCCRRGDDANAHHWKLGIRRAVATLMPSGAGIDRGTECDLDKSNGDTALLFNCSFHHMDEHGGYDGWTEHKIKVMASLSTLFTLQIAGSNRNEIKDHLNDVFYTALTQEVKLGMDDLREYKVERNDDS